MFQRRSLSVKRYSHSVVSARTIFQTFFAFAIIFPNLTGTLALIVSVFRLFFQSVAWSTTVPRFLLFLAFVSYILFHAIFFFLQNGSLSNPEIKLLPILFGIACLGLLRNIGTFDCFQTFIFRSITLFTILGIAISMSSAGALFRFPDYFPIKYGFISIYYGSVCVLFLALDEGKRRKLIYFLYILFSGSGTALLGASIILALQFRRVNFARKALVTAGTLLLFIVLQFTQDQRGRELGDIETIDRYVIQAGYVSWLQDVASPPRILFGCGIACDMESLPNYIEIEVFRHYVVEEAQGFISGRNLHSDHLRIFNHFGLIGWALAVLTLYLVLHNHRHLFWAIMAMSLLNSILTATPFFIALLASLRPER